MTNGPGGHNIWELVRTKQGGVEWLNRSGDFPSNLQSRTILVDWQYSIPALYVGTTRNVYHSVNRGETWEKFGQSLPNTGVQDLQSLPQQNILAAGTGGRGAWEILVTPASVNGQVYWDHNGNAVQNANDLGLKSVTVYLDANSNGALDSNEYVTTTDAQGKYSFAKVPPGTYSIRQIRPPGFVQTTPAHDNINVNAANQTSKDFGDHLPFLAKLVDITKYLKVTRGKAVRQGKRGHYRQRITFQNVGDFGLAGVLRFIFIKKDKGPGAQLLEPDGFVKKGRRRLPFINFQVFNEVLVPDEVRTLDLDFVLPKTGPKRPRKSFSPRTDCS